MQKHINANGSLACPLNQMQRTNRRDHSIWTIIPLVLISTAMAFTTGCPTPGGGNHGPQPVIENEPFLDTYFGTLVKSTPDSATATLTDRSIRTRDGRELASLRNVRVTVIRTEDIPGQPAWLCTLSGVLQGGGHETQLTAGDDGLRFEVFLRNANGGQTGSWITSPPEKISCAHPASTISFQHRFPYNVINPSTSAGVDISISRWRACR